MNNLMQKPPFNPFVALLIGVIAVSFSSLFVKVSTAPAIIIATYRLLFTFIILAPFALISRSSDLRQISWKDRGLAGLSGIFLALHFVTWFTSLNYTSVASSVVIVTTQPIWVVIGSFLLFKETVPPKALLGAVLALGGSVYIGATDFQIGWEALLGDILALIGAWLVSCYLLIGRMLRSRVDLQVYTFYTYGAASIVLVLTSLLFELSFHPYPKEDWLVFLGLAVICTIMGHTVFNWALKYLQASVISVGILGEPIGAITLAFLFINETPSIRQLIGGVVILTGLFIFLRVTSKQSERPEKSVTTKSL